MTNNLYVSLKNRSVFTVSGVDATKFLQGLITNDINKVDEKNVIYALMLTPQGKFLYDFFIAKFNGEYLVDCDKLQLPAIIKKLSMYKLRSDVKITDASDKFEVVALIGDKVFDVIKNETDGDTRPFCKGVAYIDPRTPKVFARSFIERENNYQSFKAFEFEAGEFNNYEDIRINSCIPTGNADMMPESSFPHDFAMDELNAIDYKKGCYVGQEVTARVHHKGSVNKKLYVVSSLKNEKLPEIGSEILAGDKKAGVLLSAYNKTALALLNKDMVEKENCTYKVNDIEITISK